jgi:CheY-like chemotaxis protein
LRKIRGPEEEGDIRGRKQIVIVDDCQNFLISMGIHMKRLGFAIIPAEDGVELLKIAKLSPPDLLMLDVHMERMDGITVLRYLKGDEETSHIPVIMISSDCKSETAEKCKILGCEAYLQKPVKIRELYEAVERCFYSRNGAVRRHPRVPFNRKVSVSCADKKYELYAETLSEGGIYLRKNDSFQVGTKVEVAFPLKEGVQMCLQGSVIYTKEFIGDVFKLPPGMAVEFSGITKNDYESLRDYIDNLLAEDILES